MQETKRAPAMAMHAPSERLVVAQLGAWEVRRHGEAGAHHAYFATRGLLHLQLWNPLACVSILTPSRLTNDRFEIWRDGIRVAVRDWNEVAARLAHLAFSDGTSVPLPSGAEVAALHAWMVVRDAVAARRRRDAVARLRGPTGLGVWRDREARSALVGVADVDARHTSVAVADVDVRLASVAPTDAEARRVSVAITHVDARCASTDALTGTNRPAPALSPVRS